MRSTQKELAEKILFHKRKYYAGVPQISDEEYDMMELELKKINPEHPVLQKVGSSLLKSKQKSHHIRPMLSLEKTYSFDDLFKWIENRPIVGTYKIDGVSISLIYDEEGQLLEAKTRGDGVIGEVVTHKIHWISSIPMNNSLLKNIEVRGELYCSKDNFTDLNNEMIELGLKPANNARNIVTGLLSRKHHDELMRFFEFVAFDINSNSISEINKYELLDKISFKLPTHTLLNTKDEIENFIQSAKNFKDKGDYSIDGVVFCYNDISIHQELGNTAHHPKFKISFKWIGESAKTTIENINWFTGRLGLVTPVAQVSPVYLSGASISNLSLHNASFVINHKLKKGDEINIIRSGEVIPKFESVAFQKSKEIHDIFDLIPKNCPSCKHKLIFDEVKLICTKKQECPAQKLGHIQNWANLVEIADLSEKRIEHMIESHLVDSPSDLYKLTIEDLLTLPLTDKKMATKLYANIQQTNNIPLKKFLAGLNILGMGISNWEKILFHYPKLEDILKLNSENIININGFSTIRATNLLQSLDDQRQEIQKLLSLGVTPIESIVAQGKLSGQIIAITGTFASPRKEIEDWIKENGGQCTSSVSSKTTHLLISDLESQSSKAKKARELNLPLINLEMLKKLEV